MDKTTLLNTIQSERARFEALIAPLNEEQLGKPVFDEGWAVKDILAHIAVWEQICARWLAEFLRGETPDPVERLDMSSNERIYRENRERSVAEVQALFQQAHQQFLQQVRLLVESRSEEELNTAHRYAWTASWPGASLVSAIADNSYEHYQDHGQQIRRDLDKLA